MLGPTTTVAHANIALVKYWGKRDAALNLPAVGSISVTLRDLYTQTRVAFDPTLERDVVLLDGAPASEHETARVGRFLDLVRARTGARGWAEVRTENNFPTGAGLASSASGFAALALAATRAAGATIEPTELSALARRGSGSAARSIFGGFVELHHGAADDGADCVATPLAGADYWPLTVLVVLTSEAKKATGSTDGMELTAATSPYFAAWVESQAADLDRARDAIRARDFTALGRVTEHSCLKMHGLMLSADPGLVYWNGATVELVHAVRALRQRGVAAYFTIDAGPQVKVLCLPQDTEAVHEALSAVPGVKRILVTALGPAARVV